MGMFLESFISTICIYRIVKTKQHVNKYHYIYIDSSSNDGKHCYWQFLQVSTFCFVLHRHPEEADVHLQSRGGPACPNCPAPTRQVPGGWWWAISSGPAATEHTVWRWMGANWHFTSSSTGGLSQEMDSGSHNLIRWCRHTETHVIHSGSQKYNEQCRSTVVYVQNVLSLSLTVTQSQRIGIINNWVSVAPFSGKSNRTGLIFGKWDLKTHMQLPHISIETIKTKEMSLEVWSMNKILFKYISQGAYHIQYEMNSFFWAMTTIVS